MAKSKPISTRGEPAGRLSSGPPKLGGGRSFLGSRGGAREQIFQISADMQQDEGHPLTDKRSPLHKAALAEYTELHKQAAAAAPPNPVPASFNETERQKRRVKEANELMNLLAKDYNYEKATIKPDISESELKGLRQHKLVATRQYSRLASEIDIDLRDLRSGVPRHIRETVNFIRGADGDDSDLTSDTADGVVRWVTREKKKRGFQL